MQSTTHTRPKQGEKALTIRIFQGETEEGSRSRLGLSDRHYLLPSIIGEIAETKCSTGMLLSDTAISRELHVHISPSFIETARHNTHKQPCEIMGEIIDLAIDSTLESAQKDFENKLAELLSA